MKLSFTGNFARDMQVCLITQSVFTKPPGLGALRGCTTALSDLCFFLFSWAKFASCKLSISAIYMQKLVCDFAEEKIAVFSCPLVLRFFFFF